MLCELSWEVVMMCFMRDVNEREREVIVMKDDDEMKEIKSQRHSCISHQMKVVNVGFQQHMLRQD